MQSLHACSQRWWHNSRSIFYMHYIHPFRHRARYVHDHVIVLFDIIVEQINFLWEVDLALENYLHMPGLDKRLSCTAENVLGILEVPEFLRLRTG